MAFLTKTLLWEFHNSQQDNLQKQDLEKKKWEANANTKKNYLT